MNARVPLLAVLAHDESEWVVSFMSDWLCPCSKNPWCPLNRSLIGTQRHYKHFGVGKNLLILDSSWTVMAHSDARKGKWRRKLVNAVGSQYPSHYLGAWCIRHYCRWCVCLGCQYSTELTPSCRFKWTCPFCQKTKSGFCTCAITFQLASTKNWAVIPALSWPLSWDLYMCFLEHSMLTFIKLTNLKYFCFLK